jgi:DNA-directed RNA polymerase III subunit RPC8
MWIWRDESDYFYDTHEWVRFAVIDEEWHDQTPTKPHSSREEPEERKLAPYKITGSMKQAGLGVCLWWD